MTEDKKVVKKKAEAEEETSGTSNFLLGAILGAGAGIGGYLLWKKYAQPTTGLKRTSSPLMQSGQSLAPIPQPTTKKEEENMIRVD